MHPASFPGSLLTILLLGPFVAAQSITTTLPTTPQSGQQDIRLWNRGSTPARVQYALEGLELQSAGVTDPMLITRLRWKPDNSGAAGTYANVTVRLSTMVGAVAGIGFDYAAHHGPDQAIVYSGPVAVAAATGSSNTPYVDIALQQLFRYVPANGPLLIDVAHDGAGWSGSNGARPSMTVLNQLPIRFATLFFTGTGAPGPLGTTRVFNVGADIEVVHAPLCGPGYAVIDRPRSGVKPLPPVPPAGTWYTQVEQMPMGGYVLRSDGAIVHYGNATSAGLPPALASGSRYVQFSIGLAHGLAVLDDGSIVSWGSNVYGQRLVPSLPAGVTWVKVAADRYASFGLRSDGQIVAWGDNTHQQLNVPSLPPGVVYTSLAALGLRVRALRSDGQIASWGSTASPGLHTVPTLPAGLRYTAATDQSMALRSDGQLVHWHTVVSPPALPSGTYYTALGSCNSGNFATRSDGVTVAWDLFDPELAPLLLPPTLSYLQIDESGNEVVGFLVGPRTSYDRIGGGCAGSLSAAELVPANTPRIGQKLQVRLFQLPLGAAVLTTGFSSSASPFGPLPIALAQFGMPGCSYFVSPDTSLFVFGQNQQAVVEWDLPNSAGLLGVRFHQQALVLDGGAGNPAGAVVSSAATAVVGG